MRKHIIYGILKLEKYAMKYAAFMQTILYSYTSNITVGLAN